MSENEQDPIPAYKAGDKSLQNETVTRIFAHTPRKFIVFEVDKKRIGSHVAPELSDFISQVGSGLWRVRLLLRLQKRIHRSRYGAILSQVLNLYETNNLNAINDYLSVWENKILKERRIQAKLQYLVLCLLVVSVIFALALVLTYLIPTKEQVILIAWVVTCGALGGFLSVSMDINRLAIDPDTPWGLNMLLSSFRIFIAMIGSAFVYFLVQANLLLGAINDLDSPYAIFVVALVAGFSETLVPNLIKQVETSQTGEKEQETQTAVPVIKEPSTEEGET